MSAYRFKTGFNRLWITISLIWIILCVIFLFSLKTNFSPTTKVRYIEIYELNHGLISSKEIDYPNQNYFQFTTEDLLKLLNGNKNNIELPIDPNYINEVSDDKLLYFRYDKKIWPNKFIKYEKDKWEEIVKEEKKKNFVAIIIIFLIIFTGPPILLLIIMRSIGWVISGFITK